MNLSALIIDDEQLAREELKYLLESMGGIDVVALGVNGIEAVDLIEEYRPDLVFLDVQMPGLDGFAAIERLLERNRQRTAAGNETDPLPQIIFATAYDQYAVRAFEVNAVDYLLKPFDLARIEQAVERVRNRLAGNGTGNGSSPAAGSNPGTPIESQLDALLRLLNQPPGTSRIPQLAKPSKLIVQAQSRLLLVDQSEICYAAIDDGVIRIAMPSYEGQSKCRTLEELLELLDPTLFWRAHRGFVVNINHIREVVPWFKSSYQLRMDDKKQTEIPVSRNQTRRLRELFNL
jgi:two-component system LytT family response regulator/two-component system response regulator LytT